MTTTSQCESICWVLLMSLLLFVTLRRRTGEVAREECREHGLDEVFDPPTMNQIACDMQRHQPMHTAPEHMGQYIGVAAQQPGLDGRTDRFTQGSLCPALGSA